MQLIIGTSTVADGSMKLTDADDAAAVATNRGRFLRAHTMKPDHATLVRLTYGRADYCEYKTVTPSDYGDGITRSSTIIADALVATTPNHPLLLPLADCIGAVIHDPARGVLMLSHLGRHNVEQFGGTASITYLVEQFGCRPHDLTVWLSPAAGKENYPLFAFEHRSLHDVARQQIESAGVPAAAITTSLIDTTQDATYYSHSEFLKGNRPSDGRFAVAAMLREDTQDRDRSQS